MAWEPPPAHLKPRDTSTPGGWAHPEQLLPGDEIDAWATGHPLHAWVVAVHHHPTRPELALVVVVEAERNGYPHVGMWPFGARAVRVHRWETP